MAKILDHYKKLKSNKEVFYKFNANLALHGFLRYFERTMLRKKDFDLRSTPSWIRTNMVNYMGFDHDHFDDNKIPELDENLQQKILSV